MGGLASWRGVPRQNWAATATSSLYWLPLTFLLVGCTLYLGYYVSAQLHPTAIETCQLAPYRRDLNPENVQLQEGGPWLPKIVRDVLFFWVIRFIIGALWAALLYYSNNRIGMAVSMSFVTGGYFVGLAIVEELKLRSDDFECHSAHPNGFSGHAFYGMWALCTIYYYYLHLVYTIAENQANPNMGWRKGWVTPHSEQFSYSVSALPSYLAADTFNYSTGAAQDQEYALEQLRIELTNREKKMQPPIPKRVELAICIVSVLCIMTQLLYTYRYGYHSLRQMALAACIGAFYCALSSLLSQVLILAFREAVTQHTIKNKHE